MHLDTGILDLDRFDGRPDRGGADLVFCPLCSGHVVCGRRWGCVDSEKVEVLCLFLSHPHVFI